MSSLDLSVPLDVNLRCCKLHLCTSSSGEVILKHSRIKHWKHSIDFESSYLAMSNNAMSSGLQIFRECQRTWKEIVGMFLTPALTHRVRENMPQIVRCHLLFLAPSYPSFDCHMTASPDRNLATFHKAGSQKISINLGLASLILRVTEVHFYQLQDPQIKFRSYFYHGYSC